MIVADKEHIKIIKEILTISFLNYKTKDNTIIFPKTYTISTLAEYKNNQSNLQYSNAIEIWNNMVLLLTFLERRKVSIPYLDEHTTYVINNEYLIPTTDFLPITNGTIPINKLYKKSHRYSSVDLQKIEELPATVPIQSVYNSLAKYIITNMFGSITASMNEIYATKLYWLLYWGLQDNHNDRLILRI